MELHINNITFIAITNLNYVVEISEKCGFCEEEND